jgi:hypothetical protein
MIFSSFLAPNVTDFTISTFLNLTGQFYLSVFAGSSGVTTTNLFTVNPSYIGSLVSRTPAPLQIANLNLIDNDLWVEWTKSEENNPCITKITFFQSNIASLSYLLSNYQTRFKVPY